MHDDSIPVEVAGFLRQASSVFAAEVPAAGAELRLLFDAGVVPVAPTPKRRPSMFRSKIATVPGRLALAAIGLTFATTGLAAANALPTPAQQAAATLADAVGVDVPTPGDTTPPPTDGTTVPPTDGTTVPPVDATTVPPVDGTTVPPVDATTVPPVDGTTVPPVDGTTVPPTTLPPTSGTTALPPAATSAQQAAHIHDFDAACGNHGQYVSYVAKNGAEPPCATSVRNGSGATPTTTGSTAVSPAAGAAPSGSDEPADPADAGKPAKAPKPAKGKSKG
jgi:hypothetical protein